MNTTISHLYADIHRAEQEGARCVTVNILDLKEVLGLADSAVKREAAENANQHVGWMKPGSILAVRAGRKMFTRVSRRRSDEFCVQVFYGGTLRTTTVGE